jgi:DNA-directed RNA polymerase
MATDEDPERVEYARQWLAYGLSRKITKRAVMITPYAGTQQGVRGYIEEAYLEGIEAGKTPLSVPNRWKAYSFLTQIVWAAIHEVVAASKAVMGYIKDIAKLYTDHGTHFRWMTPTGLLVMPMYFNANNRRIETMISGRIGSYTMTTDNEKKHDPRSAVRSASPNLIHSMDAAALTLTVNACVDDGIENFAMIHDSYGTHSTNMPKLGRILRESFVEMYLEHNILQELRDRAIADLGVCDVDLPEMPRLGTLDLHEVMDSEYFFS